MKIEVRRLVLESTLSCALEVIMVHGRHGAWKPFIGAIHGGEKAGKEVDLGYCYLLVVQCPVSFELA